MKYAVLSDCRRPTKPTGGHGLGRVACDIAAELKKRGHTVTLFAGPDSEAPDGVTLATSTNERARLNAAFQVFDGVIDCGHFHDLSVKRPELNVVDYVLDLECPHWELPKVAVANEFQRLFTMPDAAIVPLGIDVDAIPFIESHTLPKYLGYAGKIHPAKGYKTMIELATLTDITPRMIGENIVNIRPSAWYRGEVLSGEDFYRFIGESYAFIAPSLLDAGGRGLLEASATGAPVLTTDITGTQYHVENGVSGWICESISQMAYYIAAGGIELLNRKTAREWVADTHSIALMVDGLIELLESDDNGTNGDVNSDQSLALNGERGNG